MKIYNYFKRKILLWKAKQAISLLRKLNIFLIKAGYSRQQIRDFWRTVARDPEKLEQIYQAILKQK